jgi:hypothetical protein
MDDFSDVPQRLVSSLPLTIATFKKGTLHHVESIFIFFDEDRHLCIAVLHIAR